MSEELAREMLQKKILELNEQLMKELDEKFIQHLREKLSESTEHWHVETGFQIDHILSLLIMIIYMLNKRKSNEGKE